MILKFYPYDFDYKIKNSGTSLEVFIYIYSKNSTNERICVIYRYEPYFYAKVHPVDEKEIEKILSNLIIEEKEPAKVKKVEKVEKELLGKKENFWKIYVNYPKAVPLISEHLESLGIKTYEKDILFVHRFLRDLNLIPLNETIAEGNYIEKNDLKIPTFLADSLKQTVEKNTNFRILALDIETYNKTKAIDTNANPILMLAFYGIDELQQEFKKVLTWKDFNHDLDYVEHLKDEKGLLNRFKEIIEEYKPEILTGYNSDGFDLPYLKARAEKHKIKLNIGLDNSELDANNGRESKSKIKGILHLDMFQFIRYVFGKNLKTESYSLDAVSKELLNNQKDKVDIANLAHVWDNAHYEDKHISLKEFCQYNLHDAHLTLMLCKKIMPDMIEFVNIIGLPLYDLIRMSSSKLVENYILKRAIEYNVLAPNKPNHREIEYRTMQSYEGGFVYQPTPGLYQDIIVFDFKSLYPTIITSHNIGPESLSCSCCNKNKEVKVPEMDYWFCIKDKKFIPQILKFLVDKRTELKKKIKETNSKKEDTKILEARSYALKILANSFYGYLGFFAARWYCIECVKSITSYARNYIKDTLKKAEDAGFKVCYSDTDSTFLLLGNKTIESAFEFQKSINKKLPGQMELDFENYYTRGIFVAMKGSEKGAKKRYALITKDGKLKITGFETVRRNTSPLAKETQLEVLKLILQDKKKDALEYIKKVVKDLKQGNIPISKLIIKTQISKELSSYSAIGPHVAIAKKMQEKDIVIFPGIVVEYIICKGSGLIRERAKMPEEVKEGDYDGNYYLNNQILPAVSSIFAVLGYKEEDLTSESSQKGLGKFF